MARESLLSGRGEFPGLRQPGFSSSGGDRAQRRRDCGDVRALPALFQLNLMHLAAAKLLKTMELDREYQAGEVTRRFDTPMAAINGMLCALVEGGLVLVRSVPSRIIRVERLSFAPQPPSPVVADTGTQTAVATPPFARQNHGWLRDHGTSLLGVRSLAMLVRPSR
ncbi:hypothetical protein [Paraburkholderia sp. WC7.3d]